MLFLGDCVYGVFAHLARRQSTIGMYHTVRDAAKIILPFGSVSEFRQQFDTRFPGISLFVKQRDSVQCRRTRAIGVAFASARMSPARRVTDTRRARPLRMPNLLGRRIITNSHCNHTLHRAVLAFPLRNGRGCDSQSLFDADLMRNCVTAGQKSSRLSKFSTKCLCHGWQLRCRLGD